MQKVTILKIQEIIKGISNNEVQDINNDTTIDELPIDSLDMFSLINELEDLTGKSMADDEMQAINTVNDLIVFFTTD